jgi:hypothetical protein
MLGVLSLPVDLDAIHNDITNCNHCDCPCLRSLIVFCGEFSLFCEIFRENFGKTILLF